MLDTGANVTGLPVSRPDDVETTSRGAEAVFSPTIDEVVRESPCDIAVVKQRGLDQVRSILVPVRGGPHAELAMHFADAIARHHDATVVVLHLVPPGITLAVRAQAERALAQPEQSIQQDVSRAMSEQGLDERAALKAVAKARGISKSEAYRQLQSEKGKTAN